MFKREVYCGRRIHASCFSSETLSEKLADLFWIFGEVMFDVAEVEGSEDRFFWLAREEKFE